MWKGLQRPHLSNRVVGNLALVHSIHQGQHPGHVEGQLLGEEVVSHGVQPLDVGHMQQVLSEPVKVGSNSAALAGPATKEGNGLRMCA